MTTGYSTLTQREVAREILAMRKATKKIVSSRKSARDFLISAGILAKDGKHLASKKR